MTAPQTLIEDNVIASTLGKTLHRRFLVKSMAGLGAAVALGPALGLLSPAAANHTSQPYTVTANANFRSGPGTNHPVIAVIPRGATFTLNATEQNNFYGVNYKGTLGWVYAPLIVPAGSASPDPVIVGTAKTTANVNLRSGPSTGNAVLRVVPVGATVQISNTVQNGFRYVVHNGLAGWIAAQYLGSGAPGGDPYDPNVATTTARLNLRAEPSSSAKVLLVIPSGAKVRVLEGGSGQFRKVSYNGTTGWAAYAYLN
jgi:D-alanyl-D-alanine carboxypeptidase